MACVFGVWLNDVSILARTKAARRFEHFSGGFFYYRQLKRP
jgi:hypothetical protein